MAKIKYLVIHCSDTPEGRDIDGQTIKLWHMAPLPKGRGWDRPGYSDIIRIDGSIENLVPYDLDDKINTNEMTWGCKGINGISRHICVIGGQDNKRNPANTLNAYQVKSLERYLKAAVEVYPNILIAGHYHFSQEGKTCPNFDVEEICKQIGIPDKNIYHK